jgi:hypothetical protein
MPAQTHGRARNGFHILANSRGRSTNLNQAPCDTDAACEKAYCCGPAIQPLGMKPQGCKRGLCSFTPNRGRKRALALGGIGSRSSIIKRAITRRVENRNQMPKNYVPSATRPRNATEWPTVNAICKNTQPCYHCTCCTITMTKNHPRNACLGTCQNNKKCCCTLASIISPTGSLTLTVNQSPPVLNKAYFTSKYWYKLVPGDLPSIGSASAITPCNLRKVWAFAFPSISGPADIITLILEGTQPAGFTTMRIQLGDNSFHNVPISAGEQVAEKGGLIVLFDFVNTGLTLANGQQWVFGQSYSISFL